MATTYVKFKRGARPTPRHKLAASTPHRITGDTPKQFIVIPSTLSMWLNDVDGDCVTAEEAFAKAAASVMAGQKEIFIQDSTVQTWASNNGVLNGADLDQVLQWMYTSGFQQDGLLYNDGAATSVDWTNRAILTNAISKGPVKIGVAADQIQNSYTQNNGWFGVGWSQDQNEDHCVSLCGYGTLSYLASQLGVSVPAGVNGNSFGYALYTWSTIGIVDEASMLAITAEAWLRTPTTVIVGQNPPSPTPSPAPNPYHHHHHHEANTNSSITINTNLILEILALLQQLLPLFQKK